MTYPSEKTLDRLKSRCAWESTPKLSEEDLYDVLADCALVDSAGLTVADAAWSETYDLNLAAQLAWERKAGLAACDIDFAAGGARFDRSQIKKHCEDMAESYRRKRATSFGSRDAQGRSLALLPFQIANGPCGCD